MAVAPGEDFSTQLTSVDPPPMCQPRSYAAVAASNITTSKQLQEAHYVYVRRGGTIPPLAPVYSGPTGPLPFIPALPAKRGRQNSRSGLTLLIFVVVNVVYSSSF